MKKEGNIILAGVGGQGIILSSEILSLTAMEEGYKVKKSEVHGMAQRGGSVYSFIRYGEKIYSPLIEKGKGDILCSFEKAETLRWVHYLKKDNPVIIMNDFEIIPPFVSLGLSVYPGNIEERLYRKTNNFYIIPAVEEAEKIGDTKVFNVLILGFLSNFLPFKKETYIKVIKKMVPEKSIEINILAFEKGRSWQK